MKFSTAVRLTMFANVLGILFYTTLAGLIVYTIVHFVRKVW